MKDAHVSLKDLRSASGAAKKRIKQFPIWEQKAIEIISYAAASPESREVLFTK